MRRTCSTACRRSAIAHPGLAGAVLQSEEIAAEIICDGFHVHPALVRTAVAAKGPSRIMAITDGTAVSGLPVGARGDRSAASRSPPASRRRFSSDGTLAGSVLTMDRAFQMLVGRWGCRSSTPPRCARRRRRASSAWSATACWRPARSPTSWCSTRSLSVVQTYVAGQLGVFARRARRNCAIGVVSRYGRSTAGLEKCVVALAALAACAAVDEQRSFPSRCLIGLMHDNVSCERHAQRQPAR